MYKKIELILTILLLIGLLALGRNMRSFVSSGKVKVSENTVLIDPGHGGKDPGKVGVNDALEKDLNLQIGKTLKKHLEKQDFQVVMTREKDETLAEGSTDNTKVQDMKERVKLINSTAPALAVSIHQNSYHEAGIHGAQVFYYSHSTEGKKAAEIMQQALLMVDEDNTRQAKANDTYYILKRTEVPTIIIECGFLSNPEEAELLADEEYQDKLAEAVTEGVKSYLSSKSVGK